MYTDVKSKTRSLSELILGYVGSKTGALGQILEKQDVYTLEGPDLIQSS